MYAVTGSTGQVGQALTRALIGRGKQVRALYRDEAKAEGLRKLGAEPFLASVEDPSKLECAFAGVEGVFVMTPPFYKSHDPRSENKLALAALAHALRASHVTKVVFLSSIGAQHEKGTGAILKLHDMEKEFFPLNIAAASIRAAFFMENFKQLYALARESGRLLTTIEPLDRKIEMVATIDVGELAAQLLVDGTQGQLTVELEGPRQYSMEDAAEVFSKLSGRPIRAELVARAERQQLYEQGGFTAASAATMVDMADGWNNGTVAFEGSGKHQRGKTTLEEVFREA